MTFASSFFLFLFLPLTLAGYFLIRGKLRNLFLVGMSLLFYTWGGPLYIFVILGSTLMNYLAGIFIHQRRQKQGTFTARQILIACITVNLGILLYFKYTHFFIANLNLLLSYLAIKPLMAPQIALPLGISFFTFQALSYIIDVYREDIDA